MKKQKKKKRLKHNNVTYSGSLFKIESESLDADSLQNHNEKEKIMLFVFRKYYNLRNIFTSVD